jgi:hypothetical protein
MPQWTAVGEGARFAGLVHRNWKTVFPFEK